MEMLSLNLIRDMPQINIRIGFLVQSLEIKTRDSLATSTCLSSDTAKFGNKRRVVCFGVFGVECEWKALVV